MIRTVLTDSDPILRQIARPVTLDELASPEIQGVIDDLLATFKSMPAAGLAAPQIGESLCIVVVDKPVTVLVNPVLTPVGTEVDSSYEGCLSVPGKRGEVVRPQTVRVEAMTREGKPFDQVWTKFRAIVVQHEVDHLRGILYTDLATMLFDDSSVHTPKLHREAPENPLVVRETGARKTFVIESPKPVGGSQHVTFCFEQRGRVTSLRVQPGGARITSVALSGVRLKRRDYPAGAATEVICGDKGLHVAAGDQLRIEMMMPKGKRKIVAEADFDG